MFTCENCAISPEWWDNLNSSIKKDISRYINIILSPNIPLNSNYLTTGLEGLSNWKSSNVLDNSNA
jgi:hypothetical protein